MNIEAFLLCDAATDQQGKLNVLGAFDTIYAKQLPVIHPACAVVIRIRFERVEEGNHPVKILVIDEDANPVIPKLESNVEIRFSEGMDSIVVNLILCFQRLKFEKYGKYRIDLTIDNQKITDLPFTVIEVKNQTQ